MAKAIISINYADYILDLKDAVAVAEILGKAEVYEEKYRAGADNTHHVYPNISAKGGITNLKIVSTEFYNMCKLAGKPE